MRGSCLCQAVVFELRPPLRPIILCHCAQCRKTSGHFWAATSVSHSQFALVKDEALVWFQSSPKARRGFCGRCGSSLFWQPEGEARISIAAGVIDGPTGLEIAEQWFVADKGDYYAVDDSIPCRAE